MQSHFVVLIARRKSIDVISPLRLDKYCFKKTCNSLRFLYNDILYSHTHRWNTQQVFGFTSLLWHFAVKNKIKSNTFATRKQECQLKADEMETCTDVSVSYVLASYMCVHSCRPVSRNSVLRTDGECSRNVEVTLARGSCSTTDTDN